MSSEYLGGGITKRARIEFGNNDDKTYLALDFSVFEENGECVVQAFTENSSGKEYVIDIDEILVISDTLKRFYESVKEQEV